MCVCVCVRARARVRACACVCVWMRARVFIARVRGMICHRSKISHHTPDHDNKFEMREYVTTWLRRPVLAMCNSVVMTLCLNNV